MRQCGPLNSSLVGNDLRGKWLNLERLLLIVLVSRVIHGLLIIDI
jgi:hypothetical protein